MTPYRVELKPIPLSTIFHRHSWVFFSFILQLMLPVMVYFLLYVTNSLARVNRMFIVGNVGLLIIIYALFGMHVFSSIERYRRKVMPIQRI